MPVFTALALASSWVAYGAALSGMTVGASIAAGTAVTNLIVGTTLTMITSKLFAPTVRQPSPKYSTVLNQELGPRLRGYGTMLLGGTRAEWRSKGDILQQVIMLHTGPIDSIVRFWVDDKKVTLDAQNRVLTKPYNWQGEDIFHVWLAHREGYAGQRGWDGSDPTGPINGGISFPSLVHQFPDRWARDDNWAGIAVIFATLRSSTVERYPQIFPQGAQTVIRAEAKLSPVLDPRTGLRGWSENPSLCIMDYLTSRDGYRLDPEWIDQASFAAFADVCDERVPLKDGGTQARYTLNGVYSLQDDPIDVLGRMRATCDAELYETPEGKIAIRGGQWEEPTVTIGPDNLISFDVQNGSDKFQAFNELKITFTSPKAQYQGEEATRWIDPVDQARRGVISSEFNVDMVHTAAQARRLAKIYRAKENPRWAGTITTDLSGLRARYKRFIRLVIPELGIDGPFLVESHGINADLTGCTMEVRWLGADAYAWNAATEEDEEAPEYIDDDEDPSIPVPTGLALAIEGTSPRIIVATVDNPDREDLTLEAEIRTGTRWDAMTVDGFEAVSGPILATTYYVRSRFSGVSGAVSAWTEEAPITA